MTSEPRKLRRASNRLDDYDYSRPGLYFVTICTDRKRCVLGSVEGDVVRLAPLGEIVRDTWAGLPNRFPTVALDAYVVMPNHVHGLVQLRESDGNPPVQLGTVVRAFKAVSTQAIRAAVDRSFAWQPDYYEHVVRRYEQIDRIRAYIAGNPARWAAKQRSP